MNNQLKERLSRFIGITLIVVLFIAIIWTIILMGQSFADSLETVRWRSVFWFSGIIMIATILFFYSHILIHEGGHLFAGVVSGYTFLLFRIGRFGLIKENETFKIISYKMSGTLGQCLMFPPDKVIKPFQFYLAGGVIGNLLTSLVALFIFMFYPSYYLLLFSLIGLVAAVTNGIPIGYNDGKIFSKLKESETAQEQFFQQLRWNGAFIRFNKTYSEASNEKKILNVNQPITEHFNIYTKLVEINALLEQLKIEDAYMELSDLFGQRQYIITPYRVEVMREYLFCLLLLNEGTDAIVNQILMDPVFKEHMKSQQMDVYRLKSILAYFRENDREKAKKQIELAEEYMSKAPTYADRKLNTELINYTKKLMEFG